MNLKMPYGISNYEELVTENYYYVDKTKYIEKLEELPEKKNNVFTPKKIWKNTIYKCIRKLLRQK